MATCTPDSAVRGAWKRVVPRYRWIPKPQFGTFCPIDSASDRLMFDSGRELEPADDTTDYPCACDVAERRSIAQQGSAVLRNLREAYGFRLWSTYMHALHAELMPSRAHRNHFNSNLSSFTDLQHFCALSSPVAMMQQSRVDSFEKHVGQL